MFPWFMFVIYHHYPLCLKESREEVNKGLSLPGDVWCVCLMYGEELVLVWCALTLIDVFIFVSILQRLAVFPADL